MFRFDTLTDNPRVFVAEYTLAVTWLVAVDALSAHVETEHVNTCDSNARCPTTKNILRSAANETPPPARASGRTRNSSALAQRANKVPESERRK